MSVLYLCQHSSDLTRLNFPGKNQGYVPEVSTLAECDPSLLPCAEWESSFLSGFVDMRQYVTRWAARKNCSRDQRVPVPMMRDASGWYAFCFGSGIADKNRDGTPPWLHLMLQLDQVLILVQNL